MVLLITAPKELASVTAFTKQHPSRLIGLGDIRLGDPRAIRLVDEFHQAGFHDWLDKGVSRQVDLAAG